VKHDTDAGAKRQKSDFLAVANHEGETLDFHALRHTCGSWLALQGVHPNVIKTVLRHSTITLTMDTYGHLLPDQHAEAVGGMASMMTSDAPLKATGTLGKLAGGAAEGAAGTRKERIDGARECGAVRTGGKDAAFSMDHKPLQIADLCEDVRNDATESAS